MPNFLISIVSWKNMLLDLHNDFDYLSETLNYYWQTSSFWNHVINMMQCPHMFGILSSYSSIFTEEKLITCGKTIRRKFGKSLYRMYIHKIKIPYHFLSGYSGFYLCSKKIRCLKTFISGPYFEAQFWVCVRPTFCVPPLKMGGGQNLMNLGSVWVSHLKFFGVSQLTG